MKARELGFSLLAFLILSSMLGCGGSQEESGEDPRSGLALTLLRDGHVEAALDELRKLPAHEDQEAPGWLLEAVGLLIRYRALDVADSLLLAYDVKSGSDPELLYMAANLAGQRDRVDEAVSLYDRVSGDTALTATARYEAAGLLRRAGRLQEAELQAQAALEQDGRFEEARMAMVLIQLEEGENQKALDTARRISQGAGRWKLEGEALLALGRSDSAAVVLRKAANSAPEFHEARLLLSRALMAEGQAQQAQPLLEELVQRYPENLDIQRELVEAYGQLGETARADSLTSAMADQELFLQAQSLRQEGVRLSEAGQLDNALSQFEAAQRLLPDAPILANDIATVLARMGRHTEAEIRWLAAAEQWPDNPIFQRNLANLYLITGDELKQKDAQARLEEIVGAQADTTRSP